MFQVFFASRHGGDDRSNTNTKRSTHGLNATGMGPLSRRFCFVGGWASSGSADRCRSTARGVAKLARRGPAALEAADGPGGEGRHRRVLGSVLAHVSLGVLPARGLAHVAPRGRACVALCELSLVCRRRLLGWLGEQGMLPTAQLVAWVCLGLGSLPAPWGSALTLGPPHSLATWVGPTP